MKRFSFIIIMFLTAVSAHAQTTTVTGTVLDSLTRNGEPSAIIQFFKSEDLSKPIAYTTTGEDGRFTQELTGKGSYRLLFSNMGRKEKSLDFTIDGLSVIDLGEILVEDDVQTLKAGSVTAQKTLVIMEVDKLTYKVEDDVDSKTSTVLDMLRKVPMVSVDGQDNITVNGSSSFQVYVDGKPNPMISSNPSMIFKMMPASFVKNIEVVTNPGARYDAEGVGGVLNITTNTAQTGGQSIADGHYGNITLQGATKGFGGSALYSMQKGKWAMSLNGTASQNYLGGSIIEMDRVQKLESGDITTSMRNESKIKAPIYLGSINLSYEIDSLNLISAGAGITHIGTSTEGLAQTSIKSPFMEYTYDGTTFNRMTMNSITANADYQHLWADNPDRSLILSYQFSGSPSVNDTENTFTSPSGLDLNLTDRRADGKTNSLSHTAQADFTTPLGSGRNHTFSTGLKFIGRHNYSDSRNFVYDGTEFVYTPERSLEYDFYNNIGAAYAEYSGSFGKFSIKAGARYEHTWQRVTYAEGQGENFRLDYGNLVPSGSLQYNIGAQQNIGLTYNMRISRPGITYLNPYVDISDPTAKTYGNTNLEAETGHNISLVYNYFSPKWILSLSLRQGFTGNGISQYSFFDEDNLLNTTYGNVVRTSTTGLNAFVTWIPGQKTRVIFNGSTGYNDIRSEALKQQNSGFDYSILLGLQQTLPWDLRLSLNAIGAGSSVTLQGRSSGMAIGTLGLTKSFLDDKLSLSLNGVSHLTGGKGLKIESISEGPDFTSRMSTTVPIRMLTFTLSFTFGKQSNISVKTARKTIESDSQLNSQSLGESLGTMLQL